MIALALCVAVGSAAQPPAPSKPPAELVDADRLMATIAALPTKRSAMGDAEHRDGLIAAQNVLAATIKESGYTPELSDVNWSRRTDAPEDQRDWKNITFDLRGEDRASEIIIIGAHFDAVPGAPGADDNGTGVAAVLEIARVLKDRKHHRTIRFALFNLEEGGLHGSRQYVKTNQPRWKETGTKIVGMLSLEMLGYYDDKPGSQTNPFKGVPGLPQGELAGDFIALTTTATNAPFCKALADAMTAAEPKVKILKVDMFPISPPDLLRSDHAPFLAANIPAIMVTDTANFRNPNYHKPTDTAETINKEGFVRTVRALAGAVETLAGRVDKPAIEWKQVPATWPPAPAPGEAPKQPSAEPQPATSP